MFRAVNISFFHRDLYPAFWVTTTFDLDGFPDWAWQITMLQKLLIVDHCRFSVYMQTNRRLKKIHEQDANVTIFTDVSQAAIDPVATVFWIN